MSALRPMLPEDIAAVSWITDCAVSPDGSQIIMSVATPCLERDETLSTIWIIATDGGAARRLTSGVRRDHSPAWSPSGTMIAFLSERPCPDLTGMAADRPQVYAIDPSGGEARRITHLSGGVVSFAWAPDSRRLAVVTKVDREPIPETKVKVAGDRAASRPARVIRDLRYRRNGEGFIDARRQIAIVGAEDTGEREAVFVTGGDYDHTDPAWSPDGSMIAFVSARHHMRDTDNASAIWAVDPSCADTSLRCLASIGGPVSWPTFSPDGENLAFIGHQFPLDTGRHLRAWVAPLNRGEPRCISTTLDRTASITQSLRLAWVGDQKSIAFAIEDDGATVVVMTSAMDHAPQSLRHLTVPGHEVSSFSFSADGNKLAHVVSSPTMPSELHLAVSLSGHDPWSSHQCSDLNSFWRQTITLPEPTKHRFQRDGYEITFWVQLPTDVGTNSGPKIPVLLNIHGGPHAQYGGKFFDEFAVYAGAGYAVVYANPRGSSGHTEDFARAVSGDWGGGDAADVLEALDRALDLYPVLDRNRCGVMGGSYGGYLTSWIISQSDRFRAACSERALNDFRSFAATSDIGFWFAKEELGASPFEDPDLARVHSPLTYSRNIQTPLLIIHAENDFRCPIEQAEQLYVALHSRGHDVTFVRVPDADHELSRSGRPRQRVERFHHILKFFAQYLGNSNETADVG